MKLSIDMNEYVYVELTEHGMQVWKDYDKALDLPENIRNKYPFADMVKQYKKTHGYRFQLWQLMQIFGQAISITEGKCFQEIFIIAAIR